MACNEREIQRTNPSEADVIESAPIPDYDDKPLKNFCKGCGVSNIAADGCHGADCREDICEMARVEDIASDANVPFDLSFNEAHEIRDSFLINSLKGQDYISHFYEFGGFLVDNNLINSSNIVDFISFGHEVYDAVDVVRNGSENSIVVNAQLKSTCLSYINLIRSHNPPQYITTRLDMVADDLDLFEGQPRSFILSHL